MSYKSKSVVWSLPKPEFQELINSANSLSDALRKMGLCGVGRNSKTIKTRIKKENIDLTQLIKNKKFFHKTISYKKIPLDKMLVENSSCARRSLKKRLLAENLLENKCYECGLLSEWNGKFLSLQMDHINGIFNDNRLCNLRMMCPNCHSQTDTFAGKNLSKGKIKIYKSRNSPRFGARKPNLKRRKVVRPSKDDLQKLIWEKPTTHIAKDYGVSDKAVEKWAKSYKITKPPRGYWTKKHLNTNCTGFDVGIVSQP